MLKILIVDDDPEISAFMRFRFAREAPHFAIASVEGAQECLEYIESNDVDCIISDYQMPGMSGMDLLVRLRERGNSVPFIFLTAQGNEDVARDAFKGGAYDYFTKDVGFAHFARLINSIEQSVKYRKSEAALEEVRQAYQTLTRNLPGIVYRVYIREGNRIHFFNDAAEGITGYAEDELKCGGGAVCSLECIIPDEDRPGLEAEVRRAVAENRPFTIEYRVRRKDGSLRNMLEQGTPVHGPDGGPLYIDGVIFDITGRGR